MHFVKNDSLNIFAKKMPEREGYPSTPKKWAAAISTAATTT
jgi:hypothetical protein